MHERTQLSLVGIIRKHRISNRKSITPLIRPDNTMKNMQQQIVCLKLSESRNSSPDLKLFKFLFKNQFFVLQVMASKTMEIQTRRVHLY